MAAVSIETVQATPGFSTAALALRALRPEDYSTVQARLMALDQALRAGEILQEYDRDKLLFRDGPDWLRDDDAKQSLLEDAVVAVSRVAPLMDDTVEMDLQDGYVRVVPAEMGYAINWDEWYEMIVDPDQFLNPTSEPWAFCEALLQGSEEAFESFAGYYGWELRYPRSSGQGLDWEKLYRGLKRKGLECFRAAFDIAGYCTGNIYFDYNVYEDNIPLPPFSLEGVRELIQAHEAARPILADYRRCLQLFADPSIRQAVLRIYTRALKREKKSKTLVEVFREEQERARVRIGPVYAMAEDEENEYTDPLGVLERINEDLRATTNRINEMYHELGLEDPGERNQDD